MYLALPPDDVARVLKSIGFQRTYAHAYGGIYNLEYDAGDKRYHCVLNLTEDGNTEFHCHIEWDVEEHPFKHFLQLLTGEGYYDATLFILDSMIYGLSPEELEYIIMEGG